MPSNVLLCRFFILQFQKKSCLSSFNLFRKSYFNGMDCAVNNSSHVAEVKIPTAGIIIIGDEILKGQVEDINTHFLTQSLYKLGVKVQKVSVIADNVNTIAEEVFQFSQTYTHVITSGGIGPTHDDVTFEGVAMAFKRKLVMNEQIVQFLKEWFKTSDVNAPVMKMAKIPESSVLHFGEDKETGYKSKFPCVVVKNVVIFPGIPHLLQRSFKMLSKKLFGYEGGGFYSSALYYFSDEVSIASSLNDAVKKFPLCTIGSYPDIFHSYYRTKVTLESDQVNVIEHVQEYLMNAADPGSIVNFLSDTISEPWDHFHLLSDPVHSLFEDVVSNLHNLFNTYNPEEVAICYNGGKDCLVMLHILHAFMKKFRPGNKIQAVYIREANAFPQVTQFVQESVNRYNLDCETLEGPMKPALSRLLENRPTIKAVVMGTRRIDPHGDKLNRLSPTDGDWPPLMRVNLILDWTYHDVWDFIRQLFLPYCSLYDRGYTSLGSLKNTLPNPLLESKDGAGRVSFLPAYKLEDGSQERRGRS